MSIYLLILIAVCLIALCWRFILVPFLTSKGISPVLLQTITLVVEEAVNFAEQMYKQDTNIERKKLAILKISELLEEMYIDPEPLLPTIDWLIDAAVRRLPRTHPTQI